ncbi:MAG TPA: hypothetical protein VFF52_28450 [Isosphaeraceae bacterium]|nr:hypothetical protein [Isosphaeraceae bacterium]
MAHDDPAPRADEDSEPDRPITITTTDPIIESLVDHQTDWKQHADTTVAVETTQVSEPSLLCVAGVRTVVIEEPPHDKSGSRGHRDPQQGHGKGGSRDQGGTREPGRRRDQNPQDRSRDEDHRDQRQDEPRPKPQPSMMKNLLITAAVAVIGGAIGAMGYSYFFGSKSDESSSSQSKSGSRSQKEASSKTKSGGGSNKDSGKESNAQASTSSSIPGFSSAEDAETLKKQILDLMQRIDRLGERVDRMTRPKDETPPVLHTLQIKIAELAREMDEVSALPARFRHLENRVETLREDLKILRSRIDAMPDGSPGGPPLPGGTGVLGTGRGSDAGESPTMELGISLLERGQAAGAREIFQRLQLAQPKDARVWYFSAMAEGLASGDWDGAAKKLAEQGLERERAGTPPTAQIDAALATRAPIKGQEWIASLRRRILSVHDGRP